MVAQKGGIQHLYLTKRRHRPRSVPTGHQIGKLTEEIDSDVLVRRGEVFKPFREHRVFQPRQQTPGRKMQLANCLSVDHQDANRCMSFDER